MKSIKLHDGAIGAVRGRIPLGIEHYILHRGPDLYLNIRTNDVALIRELKALAETDVR